MIRLSFFTLLFFLSCTASKNNSTPKSNKNNFLPVCISYQGIAIDDSLKTFITQYLQSKNVRIISRDEAMVLAESEIRRAASYAKSSEDFRETLKKYQRYVCNLLTIEFDLSGDNQKILMGWHVIQYPIDFNRMRKTTTIFLKNYQITSDPPQQALQVLCDSIIISKTLN